MRALRWLLEGHTLTPAELLVLQALADGATAATFANAHGKSVYTVRMQQRTARARLGATTTTHAVAIAIRRGLVR